ncbi:MAG: type II secretion system F family protein [Gammaproteobacteria bacterium]|nr:type II secretion system F family protein [Gammaproteobacteria bacterium]MCP5135408.1 type II secretion system F family protein [Gammaproteobacteria bacterium]
MRADSAEQARALSGERPEKILRATPDWWRMANEARPNLRVQGLVLTQLAALVTSSGGFARVPELIRAHSSLRRQFDSCGWSTNQPLSGLIEALGFDPVISPMVKAGEASGRLSEMLEEAADYLSLAADQKKSNMGHLVMAMVLLVGAIVGLLQTPDMIGKRIDQVLRIQHALGVLEPSSATKILIWLRDGGDDLLRVVLIVLLAVIVVLWLRADAWSDHPTWARLVSPIQSLRRPKRSANLLTVLRPLYAAGVKPEQMMPIVRRTLGAAAAPLTAEMRRGYSLSAAIEKTTFWWSRTLVQSIQGFESATPDSRERLLRTLVRALNEEDRVRSARLAMGLYGAGMVSSLGMVMLLAFGYLLPMSGAGR